MISRPIASPSYPSPLLSSFLSFLLQNWMKNVLMKNPKFPFYIPYKNWWKIQINSNPSKVAAASHCWAAAARYVKSSLISEKTHLAAARQCWPAAAGSLWLEWPLQANVGLPLQDLSDPSGRCKPMLACRCRIEFFSLFSSVRTSRLRCSSHASPASFLWYFFFHSFPFSRPW